MKKLKIVALLGLISLVTSCGDDSPLQTCYVCTHVDFGSDEYCAGKVAAETYKASMESSGYSCSKK
jgi:hypothetical protein